MKKYLAALLLVPTMSQAAFISGNSLYTSLISDQTHERLYAIGYITGVHDALETTTHCSPSTVTAGQVRDVVKRYLEQNPDVRNLNADLLIRVSLGIAWPCPKKGKPA